MGIRNPDRNPDERGANLVEFAILAPLLLLLLFGIIEFAWLFTQNLDVRHGAREGARIAATDDFSANPVNDVCSRMDTANGSGTIITIDRNGDSIGDDLTINVDAPPLTLTGFMDAFLPSSLRLESTATVRIEQAPSWGASLPITGSCP